MALGSHVPEWKALKEELDRLATSCRAHFVAVISTGNVLCVNRHDRRTDSVQVRAAIHRALPRIEALTLSLPPPNPSPAEGAGKLRA